ncbi:hypothetical protein ACFY3U_24730 [Micromonospora sp. NPDC000089]|uniref:hypothetical protein n=1 Tax=unclassified Micromonospora TaxID=2617518 RepID=UPI003682A951
MVDGEPEELLRTRFWPAVLVPIGVLVALTAVALRYDWAFLIGAAVGIGMWLFFAVLLRGGGLLADETGLLVRERGRVVRSYRWDQIREAGLSQVGHGRMGLIVLPDGGPYDVPGPNSPVTIGQVWMLRGPDRATRDRVAELLRAHGIPRPKDLGHLANTPQRAPRQPPPE